MEPAGDGEETAQWDGVEMREKEDGAEVIEWDGVETVEVGQIMIEESGEGEGGEGGEGGGEYEVGETEAATNDKTEPGK